MNTKANICSQAKDGTLYTGYSLLTKSRFTNILSLYVSPYIVNTSSYESFQILQKICINHNLNLKSSKKFYLYLYCNVSLHYRQLCFCEQKGKSWLPGKPNMIRGLEISGPPLTSGEGRGTGERVQSTITNNLINHASVMKSS